MATWYFRQKPPGEKERNPVGGEYFDEEAIDRPAQALVREVIQNSLDAHPNGGAVEVRFYISGKSAALPAVRAARWLGAAWHHFTAEGSGLRNVPERSAVCPFLVVEDRMTIGLEGDPEVSDLRQERAKTIRTTFMRSFVPRAYQRMPGDAASGGLGRLSLRDPVA